MLSAADNSLDGDVPQCLCKAVNLSTLVLNGIGNQLHDVRISASVRGTLPECIWSLPKLRVLYAAGNRLKGNLPEDSVHISQRLEYVNIAYNELRGNEYYQ